MAALSPADATWPIDPDQVVVAQLSQEPSRTELGEPRSECTMQPATTASPPRRATALLRASTARRDFMRSLME